MTPDLGATPTIHAGGLEIGARSPRVVGTISTRRWLESFSDLGLGSCDVAEVRLDQIGVFDGWISVCAKIEAAGVPVLLTLRSSQEGGKCSASDDERLEIFRLALTCASIIDVELGSGLAERLRPEVQRAKKILLVSHHDFSGTPFQPELESVIARAALHGSIVKVATMVNGDDDLRTLRTILAQPRDFLLCLIGMGAKGIVTRTSFPSLGSCLTYGYLDSVVAPGQLAARELMDLAGRAVTPPRPAETARVGRV